MPKIQRNRYMNLVILALFLALLTPGLMAGAARGNQDAQLAPERVSSSSKVILRAAYSDQIPPAVPAPRSALAPDAPQTAVINVTYAGPWTASAKAAFEYAANIWETLVVSSVPIHIEAEWAALPPGVLGGAGAYNYWRNFPGAPQSNTWYPAAIAHSRAGYDLDGSDPEIFAIFSSTFSNWYFGTDGNPPGNQYDFVSVVLHEIGHGLGFSGSMTVDNGSGSIECNGISGYGCWGYGTGTPFAYDRYTENGANQALLNTGLFPNPSSALGNQLRSNNIFFDGPNATAANGGTPPRLYAPGSWQQGSSYSHLDESTYAAGTANALMTPQISNGEANHNPGPITLGIFADTGWILATTNTEPTLNRLPNQNLPMGSSLNNAIDLWLYANDAESPTNTLSFTIDNVPNASAGVSINSNRYININPSALWVGQTDVTIRVMDPMGASQTDTFRISVTNTPPSISGLPNQVIALGNSSNNAIDLWAYTLDNETADADLAFSISNTPDADAGVTLDSNRYIDINPSLAWTGQTSVVIEVSDPAGKAASDMFIVYVVPPGVTPPTVDGLPDQRVMTDSSNNQAIDLWAYADDAESDDADLVFTIENTPEAGAGVSIDANRYIDINPTAGWSGETSVTVRVTDPSGYYDVDAFVVIVGARVYLPVTLQD